MRINSMATQCYKAMTNQFKKAKKCISVSGNCGSNQNILTPTELETWTTVANNEPTHPSSALVVDVASRPSTAPDLSTYLNRWVNEKPNERQSRQLVKDQITIINDQLVVDGNLALKNTNISSLPKHLHIRGNFNLAHLNSLNEFPQGLIVRGSLNLINCRNLRTIHNGLTVGADLDLGDCINLTSLPQGLTVGGNLDLSGCTELEELPQGLTVGGNLNLTRRETTDLSRRPKLTTIHNGLSVGGNLHLSHCPNLKKLPQDLTVGEDLDLSHCPMLTTLPKNLLVKGNLDLSRCPMLTTLPQGLTVRGNLNLHLCTSLTALPQGLHVGTNLSINDCTNLTALPVGLFVGYNLDLSENNSLTALPQGLHVGRNLLINGCTNLTELSQGLTVGDRLWLTNCTSLSELPNWLFELSRDQVVTVRGTGIPPRLLAEYNNRQLSSTYNGPQIAFSINDYLPTTDVCATQLPNLVQTITETDANHTFWQFAATQREQGPLFSSFALFLTRLLNELPSGNKRERDLDQLNQKLTPLFRKMEAEYDANDQDIRQCDFINNHILSAAETAIGTCIDKVKVGYLFMQLFIKDNFNSDLDIIATIIKIVDDIASARVVFDPQNNQFIHVAKTILDGDFDDNLKLQAKVLLKNTDDSIIELTDNEMEQVESGLFTLDSETLAQTLAQNIKDPQDITDQNPEIRDIFIGDQVEDILNLAYKLLNNEFHKIDMRWDCCRTLKDSSDPSEPQYETAAISYVQQEIRHHDAT